MSHTIVTDIGGTFTDMYVRDSAGDARSFKVPTTPSELTDGVFDALAEAADLYDVSIAALLAGTDRFIHGTTVSTNAIIEDDVAETALLCTDGFRDTLWFREGGKTDPYDWDMDYPDPYVPRSQTYGVEERITAEGEIHTELNESQVREVAVELADSDTDAVAVSLLWSHANPSHERRIGEILEDEAPSLHYSLSHEVNPIIREYRRTSSTVIDASIHDLVGDYLHTLQRRLREHGYDREPLIITGNGGVMPVEEIVDAPIWTVDAGPTMLPNAAGHFVESELGKSDVIALDMGGTSLDMGVVRDGMIPRIRDAEVGNSHMMGIEKVEIKSIGSGGGSIAWVDDGKLLHVGPQSAGSEPGPACYGRGGTRPTVTDAALTLGYLSPEYFLGGDMEIVPHRAEAALEEHVGEPLGMNAVNAAQAVYDTSIQNMVNGIKDVTVERGIDPRNYVLSGGGGALGMNVVSIAREVGVEDIVLPREAGVVSSVGGATSDLRRDFSASQFTQSDGFAFESVNDVLSSLESKAERFFERTGVPTDRRELSYYTEARYPYQVWDLELELPVSGFEGEEDLRRVVERFHQTHERTYGFRTDEDVEFLYWRVEASGVRDKETVAADNVTAEDEASPYVERDASFDRTVSTAPRYRDTDLIPGQSIDGPAFVDGRNTTIVLPPNSSLTVTMKGNYHIDPKTSS